MALPPSKQPARRGPNKLALIARLQEQANAATPGQIEVEPSARLIAVAEARGVEIPATARSAAKPLLGIRVDEATRDLLRAVATAAGCNVSQWVQVALADRMVREGRQLLGDLSMLRPVDAGGRRAENGSVMLGLRVPDAVRIQVHAAAEAGGESVQAYALAAINSRLAADARAKAAVRLAGTGQTRDLVPVLTRMTAESSVLLDAVAASEGISKSQLVITALSEWLHRHGYGQLPDRPSIAHRRAGHGEVASAVLSQQPSNNDDK